MDVCYLHVDAAVQLRLEAGDSNSLWNVGPQWHLAPLKPEVYKS
jgi:hypothetical protein